MNDEFVERAVVDDVRSGKYNHKMLPYLLSCDLPTCM